MMRMTDTVKQLVIINVIFYVAKGAQPVLAETM